MRNEIINLFKDLIKLSGDEYNGSSLYSWNKFLRMYVNNKNLNDTI